LPKSAVYGPVGSWRLGRSLGVDMLCTEEKTCNFNCVYCQLGPTVKPVTERQDFVSLGKLIDDLNACKGVAADWVTFAGMGEPTLAANLGSAMTMARSITGLPVAVFTNGSLLRDESVRHDLMQADMVIVKLDAHEDALFQAINRPAAGITFAPIIQNLQMFRFEYKGKIAVDMMLSDLNKESIYHISYMSKMFLPDQVHLNTPVRPGTEPVKPLPPAELEAIRKNWFWNQNGTSTVYSGKKPQVTPLDEAETELRHPTRPKAQAPPADAPAAEPKPAV
jgi:wyosine [tRNA(Phe)-imidazoG37] synthetase (radical SAM superfamily)